jgi:hypothetical protein
MTEHTSPQTNALAVISLVFGVLGWTLLPLIGIIVAIVTGHLALGQIRRSNGTETGEGLAIAGLVLGYLGLAVAVMAVLFIILGILGIGLLAFLA